MAERWSRGGGLVCVVGRATQFVARRATPFMAWCVLQCGSGCGEVRSVALDGSVSGAARFHKWGCAVS